MKTSDNRTFLNRSYTDTVRGICMLLIVFSHTANEFPEILSSLHLSRILQCGTFASAVFFFLSGYGLTISLESNSIDSNYLQRRFSRLFAPYLFFWIFYLTSFAIFRPSDVYAGWGKDFLCLKMPEADTWFFRVILCSSAVYIFLYKYAKRHAAIFTTIITVAYISACMLYAVPSWWYDTVICFPLGILHARCKALSTGDTGTLVILAVLFLISWNFYIGGMITACAILSIIVARISVMPAISILHNPMLSFIGVNSLWIYFMEAIPIDIISSHKTGFLIYVSGGIIISIALTWAGKKLYTLIFSK